MDEIKNGTILLDYYRVVNNKARQGATSTIMKAYNDAWEKDIAVKIPHEEFFSDNKNDFFSECRIWTNLPVHPYIIQCHFAGAVDNTPMLFLEWCDGCNVKEMIAEGSLYEGTAEEQQNRIISIAMQSIAGIVHAHANGVIHKDIKPQNIMVTKGGMAKLTDFGSADSKYNSYTCEYCSPEQLTGKKITEKTDVFSWAVTCIEMFCGKCTWSSGNEVSNFFEFVTNKAVVEIPPELKELLRSALSMSPDDRPCSKTVMETLGELFGRLMETDKNLRFFRRLPDTETDPDYLNNKALSMVFVDESNYKNAIPYFDKAISINPKQINAVYNKHCILWVNGEITADEFVNAVFDHEATEETFTEEVLSATQFSVAYAIECTNAETGESYRPFRFNTDGNCIIFCDEKHGGWKILDISRMEIIDNFILDMMPTAEQLEKATDIKWENNANTGFLPDRIPRINGLPQYSPEQLYDFSCMNHQGTTLVIRLENTAYICFRSASRNCRLSQSPMPSSEEMADACLEKLKNKKTESEENMPLFFNGDTIGRDTVILEHLVSDETDGIIEEIYSVYNYSLDRKLRMHLYSTDDSEVLNSIADKVALLANVSFVANIIGPVMNVYNDKYVCCFYDECDELQPVHEAYIREINEEDFANYLIAIAYTTIHALNICNTHPFSFVHGGICPESFFLDIKNMSRNISYPMTKLRFNPINTPTSYFTAPEQHNGGELTPKTDVYIWAVTILFLIAWNGNMDIYDLYEDATPEEMLAFANTFDTSFTKVFTDIMDLLKDCLAENPDDRPDLEYLTIRFRRIIGDFFDDALYFTMDDLDAFTLNGIALSNIHNDWYSNAKEVLNRAIGKYPDCFSINYNKLVLEINAGNKPITELEGLKKATCKDELFEQVMTQQSPRKVKTIKLTNIKDSEGNKITCRFSDNDTIYTSYDGSKLIIQLEEIKLALFIDLRSGKVIESSDNLASLMFEYLDCRWKSLDLPFSCNQNFSVCVSDKGLIYGHTSKDAPAGTEPDPDSFGYGEIKDITGCYAFFTDFTENTPVHMVAGQSGKNSIVIYDIGLTPCRYITSSFSDCRVKLSKYDGYSPDSDSIESRLRNKTIEDFGDYLSVRAFNCLKRAGYNTMGEILDLTDEEFNSIPHINKKNVIRIRQAIIIDRTAMRCPGTNVFYLLDYTFLEPYLSIENFEILKSMASENGLILANLTSKKECEFEEWFKENPQNAPDDISEFAKSIREALRTAEEDFNDITMSVSFYTMENIENEADDFDEEEDSDEVQYSDESLEQLISANNNMRAQLLSTVKGQDHVVHKFCDTILDSLAFSRHMDNNRPLAVFTFAGPPGVGKTFLAEQTAKLMGWPCKRFDMTEYSDHQSQQGLIGFEYTWSNSQEGVLTSFVRENPRCILIFDEIEKAHKNVIHLFYQMLEAGVLTDKYHATRKHKDSDEYVDPKRGLTSFKDTIIIFTTNAGRALYEGAFSDNCAGVSTKTLLNALSTEVNPQTKEPFFPTALVSRISTGCPVIFNNLKPYHLTEIIRGAFDTNAKLVKRVHDIDIEADNDVILSWLFASGGKSDARQLSSNTGPFFREEIKNAMEKTERYDIKKFHFTADIDADTCSSEVYSLFRETKNTNVLIYSSETTAEVCSSCLGDNFSFYHADNFDAACMIAEKYDVDIILLDIAHRDNNSIMLTTVSAGLTNYSSKSASAWKDGYRLFKFLREKMGELPIYLLEDTTFPISSSLLSDFVCAGARGKIPLPLCIDGDDTVFANTLNNIGNQLYMEKKAFELSQKSNVLTFDTAPMVKDNEIVIELRNFELKFAVDADDASSVLSDMERPDIRFKDVIGASDAKESLKEFIKYLQNPKSYTLTGKTVPKGVLLYGNPGTGKTMLAKAMAGECNIPFIATNASSFVKQYSGTGPAAVRELFAKARKYAPSIIFIDEVDTIAKQRTGSNTGQAEENTLNALLAEMDGFNTNTKRPVFVIAATNYDKSQNTDSIGKLDDAFMRRFDRPIKIELPDKKERIQLINMLLGKLSSHNVTEKDVESIAERTAYISPAILTNIFQTALRKMADGEKLSGKHLDEALETEMYGKEYKRSEEDMLRTARHECGHALLYAISGHTPAYLTIVARGNFNGYMQLSDEHLNERHHNKQDLLNRICSMLAGRAAEMVYYENEGMGTGASSDLEHATALACSMVTKFGMDEEFGLAVWNDEAAYKSPEVRKRVNEILLSQLNEATRIIKLNKTKFDKLVAELVKENSLSGDRIEQILGKKLKK